MPTRTVDQNTLKLGLWNSVCDVCNFKFKSSDLRKRWDGLYVCADDFEVRQPLDLIEGIPDDPSVPWSRPDNLSDTNVTVVGGALLQTDNTVDFVGDTDKTLTVGSAHTIQNWNTVLTADRTVILTAASEGDRWKIYRTGGGTVNLLIIGSVKITPINSITVVEYRSGWKLISYTPLGL